MKLFLIPLRWYHALQAWQAEIRHHSAVQCLREARREIARAAAMAEFTRGEMTAAKDKLSRVLEKERRHEIRRALGI